MRWSWLPAVLVFFGLASNAQARTLTVSTTADSGPGSLRQEVQQASAGDTVIIPASSHHYKVFSKIQVTQPITLQGAGPGKTVIQGGGATRVFEVTSGVVSTATVTVKGLTITGGHTTTPPGGGAILVDSGAGSLDIIGSVLEHNSADVTFHTPRPGEGGGGAVYMGGAGLLIERSILVSNQAGLTVPASTGAQQSYGAGGGAVYDAGTAPITITGSQLVSNTLTVHGPDTGSSNDPCCNGGGALYENVTQPLSITGSTFAHNSATVDGGNCCHGGGAIYVDAPSSTPLTISSSHLDHNMVAVTTKQQGHGCCSGGGALATFAGIIANGTSFDFNSATMTGQECCNGGGAMMFDSDSPPITLHKTDLSHNTVDISGPAKAGGTSDTCCNGGGALQLLVNDPPLSVVRSTLADNQATVAGTTISGGGAVYEDEDVPINTYSDTTIAGNSTNASGTQQGGGAMYVYNETNAVDNLTNVTLAQNSAASGEGGGILNIAGDVHSTNSIISGNTAGQDPSCSAQAVGGGSATFSSGGHTIESSDACGLTGPGDQVNTNPLLGPLQANGRTFLTMALLDHSPAINAGDNAACPATDERGKSRPQPAGGTCDIGAYEDIAPTEATQWASKIAAATATLHAAINPQNLTAHYRFQYGRTQSYGSTTPSGSAGQGFGLRTVSTGIHGLSPNTTYHYRVLATNQIGTTMGPDMTFTTHSRTS